MHRGSRAAALRGLGRRGYHFAAATTHGPNLRSAVEAAVQQCAALLGAPPTFCHVLVTPHYPNLHTVAPTVYATIEELQHPPPALIGGVVAGLLGGGPGPRSDLPSVHVVLGHLPGTTVAPFVSSTSGVPFSAQQWKALQNDRPGHSSGILFFADPFFLHAESLLLRIGGLLPQTPVSGGTLLLGTHPDGSHGTAFLNEDPVAPGGAVGLILHGAFSCDTLCIPGARPLGRPMVVSRCDGSTIGMLDGRPALDRLREELLADGVALDAHRAVMVGLPVGPTGGHCIRHAMPRGATGLHVAAAEPLLEGSQIQLYQRRRLPAAAVPGDPGTVRRGGRHRGAQTT